MPWPGLSAHKVQKDSSLNIKDILHNTKEEEMIRHLFEIKKTRTNCL